MAHTFVIGGSVNINSSYNSTSSRDKIINILGGDIEQVCNLNTPLLQHVSSNIVGLTQYAFANHKHMVLDPDSVWLTIEHGLATHIKLNAEELRSKFITFQGKVNIKIRRDEFVKGSNNNWESCFDEFSEKIGNYIGSKKDLIIGNFSTTKLLQRVSSEIVLMDAMSKYFTYDLCTMCHIPIVTLEGTVEDWELIRDKVNSFDELGLSWWTEYLKPVLDEFVNASKGNPNISFWKNWYSEGGGSGGPYISGYVNTLYPYIGRDNEKNNYLSVGSKNTKRSFIDDGNTISSFNNSISKVPFIWSYYDTIYPMEFSGGIIGVSEDNGIVKCEFGWAVRDESVPINNYPLTSLHKDMRIFHKNGSSGLLKKAECEHFSNNEDSKKLSDLHILWDNGKLEILRSYQFQNLFIKEPVSNNTENL